MTLHLNEDERVCVIKRRVAAPDGTTSLFVDNARKTLIELDEVKRSWKLEGARFAFIGQGEIQETVKQSPSERRMRLETLFGIDIYRKKRMDSQNRLDTVRTDYDQLRHLMGELSSRREEIAPDVARAAEMREILDSIEGDRKLLYWLRRASCESVIEQITQEIEAAAAMREGRGFFLDPFAEASLSSLQGVELLACTNAIGPEGGWSPRDREQLVAAGYDGLRLGPRVLRTETAGIAAIAALQAACGDLG